MCRRLAVSLAIGISSGTLCWAIMRNLGLGACDFTPALREAQQMLAGGNPFIFATRHYPAYPLPAAMVGLPFLWLKTEIAAGAFFGVSSAVLAFGLTREGYTRLLIFLAYPYWTAMLTVQWAPLLMASALLPWLLPVTTAKPQLGASIFLAYPTRRGIVGCIVLVGLSLLLMPHWPRQWLASLGFYDHYVPLFAPAGLSLLLAAWRRQDPDSHLLLLSSAAPQRWFYDTFILWLIPKTRQEILATVFLSWGAGLTRWYHMPRSWDEVGAWAVLWIYVPMLSVLLLRATEAGRRESERQKILSASIPSGDEAAAAEH